MFASLMTSLFGWLKDGTLPLLSGGAGAVCIVYITKRS